MKNIYGYDYKKLKRGKDYIHPSLSEKDEYIPVNYIGMYSLLRDNKNNAIYMGEAACQNLRRKTYQAVLAIFRKYNSPDYADLWNYNIATINELGLNYFSTIKQISPIAGLIECIEQEVESRYSDTLRNKLMVSFAIRSDLLNKYLRNYAHAKRTGEQPKIPQLTPKVKKTREEVIFGKKSIRLSGNQNIIIDKNAICNRFEEWLKIYNIDEKRGILMALESLFDKYPVDGLGDNQYYGMVTELDKIIFDCEKETGTEKASVILSKKIYTRAMKIIRKYNLDANNLAKGEMTFDSYVNNALHLLNTNMPKEYRK